MHQGLKSITLRTNVSDDLLDHFTVSKLNVGSRRIDDQLLCQIPSQLVLVLKQNVLVVRNVLEGAALGSRRALFDVRAAIDAATGVGNLDSAGLGLCRNAV